MLPEYAGSYKVRIFRKLCSKKRSFAVHRIAIKGLARDRAELMYASFYFDEEFTIDFERIVNELITELWEPGSIAVVDESMGPYKGRGNPHHVFIIRKPHPHGLKVRISPLRVSTSDWSPLLPYSGLVHCGLQWLPYRLLSIPSRPQRRHDGTCGGHP